MLPSASSATKTRATADEARWRGRRTALAILALAAAPVVAAWLAYFVWPPRGRTNYGELIPPLSLAGLRLKRLDGTPLDWSALSGRWVLVQLDSGSCDDYCRTKLLYLRQLKLAQGKDGDRLERLWLVTDARSPVPSLLEEFRGTEVARIDPAQAAARFPAPVNPADHIYVVDPRGNLMLRFPRDPDPRGMLKDLGRLLRVSQVG